MDFVREIENVKIFDDFAHHPTAINQTSQALREEYPDKKIMGIIELGSNTMSSGHHKENLLDSFEKLDEKFLLVKKNIYEHINAFEFRED